MRRVTFFFPVENSLFFSSALASLHHLLIFVDVPYSHFFVVVSTHGDVSYTAHAGVLKDFDPPPPGVLSYLEFHL